MGTIDFRDVNELLNLPKQPSRVMGLTISADGRKLAIGHINGDVQVFAGMIQVAPGAFERVLHQVVRNDPIARERSRITAQPCR